MRLPVPARRSGILGDVDVVIVASGSRGDVAPYAGLGRRLRAAGHTVTIAAHEPFRALVAGAGLGFHPLPGDVLAVIGAPAKDGPISPWYLNRRIPQLSQYLLDVADGVVEATRAAEVVLVGGGAPFAEQAARARGVPSIGVYLQPFEPTGEFPSPLTNSARSLGRPANRWVGKLVTASLFPYARAGARIRERLGLPAESAAAIRRRLIDEDWPIFHGYSTAVLPRPRDWRPGLRVTGYWWPPDPPGWTPPPALSAFLAAEPAPVLVTFGSMAAGTGRWLADIVVEAVRRAGVRAVVQAGWAGLDLDGADVLTVGEVPHSWLMPRVAAVVHHGGAGTTAAGLRAGVPTVTTPIYADQPLWGRRVAELGLGPPPVPFRRLTAERLSAAVRAALADPRYRARAQSLAGVLAAEDGAAEVVSAVGRLDR